MIIARVAVGSDVVFASVEGVDDHDGDLPVDARLRVIDVHPFGEITFTGQEITGAQARLLAPVLPSKVIAVGRNYAAHAAEMGNDVPAEPMIFLKPNTSVIGPGAEIRLPAMSQKVEHEAELAIVIGRLCREVPEDRVDDVILGYTCANDVTARDLQKADGQWGRAKGFDTFCPSAPGSSPTWTSPTLPSPVMSTMTSASLRGPPTWSTRSPSSCRGSARS